MHRSFALLISLTLACGAVSTPEDDVASTSETGDPSTGAPPTTTAPPDDDEVKTNQNIFTENENKGGKGAYFLVKNIQIKTETKEWFIVANVNQNQSKVVKLSNELKNPYQVINAVLTDIKNNTNSLINLVNTADGIQRTGDFLKDSRHFANVVFNCMRGGVFDKNYQITKDDFVAYLQNANPKLATHFKRNYYNQLPENVSKDILEELDLSTYNIDFKRLAKEYLPLYFSRRHGDPSRPWNKFDSLPRSRKYRSPWCRCARRGRNSWTSPGSRAVRPRP